MAFSVDVDEKLDDGGVGSSSSKLLLDDGVSDDFVGDGDEKFDDGGSSSSRVAFSSDGSAGVSNDGSADGVGDGLGDGSDAG